MSSDKIELAHWLTLETSSSLKDRSPVNHGSVVVHRSTVHRRLGRGQLGPGRLTVTAREMGSSHIDSSSFLSDILLGFGAVQGSSNFYQQAITIGNG